jgi:hypothetical protein
VFEGAQAWRLKPRNGLSIRLSHRAVSVAVSPPLSPNTPGEMLIRRMRPEALAFHCVQEIVQSQPARKPVESRGATRFLLHVPRPVWPQDRALLAGRIATRARELRPEPRFQLARSRQAVQLSTMAYFVPKQEAVISSAGSLPRELLKTRVDRWIFLNYFRNVAGVVAFVLLVRAVLVPGIP